MKKTAILFTALLASAAYAQQAQIHDGKQSNLLQAQAPLSATDDDWHVAVTPYAWLPTLDLNIKTPVNIGAKHTVARVAVNEPWWNTVSDLFKGKVLMAEAAARIEVSKGRWGAFVDGYWIYSKVWQTENSSRVIIDDHGNVLRTGRITNWTDSVQINFGPRYLLGTRPLDKAGNDSVGLELYGGGRFNWISSKTTASLSINKQGIDVGTSGCRGFVEPMIGLKTIWNLGPNFVGVIRGDVGGWNVVENNTDCDLEAAIAWQFHKNTFINLGYRARGQWQAESKDNVSISGWLHGPELGMTFVF